MNCQGKHVKPVTKTTLKQVLPDAWVPEPPLAPESLFCLLLGPDNVSVLGEDESLVPLLVGTRPEVLDKLLTVPVVDVTVLEVDVTVEVD